MLERILAVVAGVLIYGILFWGIPASIGGGSEYLWRVWMVHLGIVGMLAMSAVLAWAMHTLTPSIVRFFKRSKLRGK